MSTINFDGSRPVPTEMAKYSRVKDLAQAIQNLGNKFNKVMDEKSFPGSDKWMSLWDKIGIGDKIKKLFAKTYGALTKRAGESVDVIDTEVAIPRKER